MKYYTRLKVYKANNVLFDTVTKTATSYGWWEFVKDFNGVLVFNDYNYSVSTCKHQAKVRTVLHELGYSYITIKCPSGLQNMDSAVNYYQFEISKLRALILKPGTHKAKNDERKCVIKKYKAKLEQIVLLKSV